MNLNWWVQTIFFVILVVLGIVGIWRTGSKKLLIRWLLYAALIIGLAGLFFYAMYYMFFVQEYTFLGVYSVYLSFAALFAVLFALIHRLRSGGQIATPPGEMDEFTLNTIRKLKRIRFNPPATLIAGMALIMLSFYLLLGDVCLIIFPCVILSVFIFLPLAIILVSVGYAWNKNKGK
jgi:hypothetical protein